MALAALAILGHRSAHSFPMGPVIADPEKRKDRIKELINLVLNDKYLSTSIAERINMRGLNVRRKK